MIKTNLSTLHRVNNIQRSATQGSNDTTYRLSRRTAATTRFSPEGIGSQKQTAPRFCQQSDQEGLYRSSIHQMAPQKRGRTHLIIALLLIYRPRKDEKLSWPSWLTCFLLQAVSRHRINLSCTWKRLSIQSKCELHQSSQAGPIPSHTSLHCRQPWARQSVRHICEPCLYGSKCQNTFRIFASYDITIFRVSWCQIL